MENEKRVSEGKLLYDPMFAKKAVLDWTDSEKGGLFGKAKVKKTLFIIVLLLSICGSLFFSFSSLSKERYEFTALDNGTYRLDAFHGQKNDTVLSIDYVKTDDGIADTSKPVSAVKKYTVSGNDTLQFIFIGKSVEEIEPTAFFYCTALNAIFVDDENEHYADVDGVLYKKENGVLTEAVLCPQGYSRYVYSLSEGNKAPANPEEAAGLSKTFADETYVAGLTEKLADEKTVEGKSLVIPETVKKINQLCFAYCDAFTSVTLPPQLKEIETMAFFKCAGLKEIDLPDTLEVIGSDAFSKCSSLTYLFIPRSVESIGHNAFWDCGGIEKVYMEAENLDGIETGHNWAPQYRKTIMRDREIVFGAERGVK